MKKLLLLGLALSALSGVFAQQPAKRYVLIEHFTNSRCGVCSYKNPVFYKLIDQYPKDVHHISIHPSYPYPSCVLYAANKTENEARRNFYGIDGTPQIALNGALQNISDPLLTKTKLEAEMARTSPISVTVEEKLNGATLDVKVKVKVVSAPPAGTYKFYAAILEKKVFTPSPALEKDHFDVFRKMLTNVEGIDIVLGPVGSTQEYTFSQSLISGWVPEQMFSLAFVQNASTKEVLNSGTRFDAATTAANESTPLQKIQLAPNPTSDITYASLADDKARSVEVFNLNGQRVDMQVALGQEKVAIPTVGLQAGIYFVKIKGEKRMYAGKFVRY